MSSKEAYNKVEISAEEISAIDGEKTTVSESPKEETQENSVQEQPIADSKTVDSRATNPEGSNSNLVYELEMNGQTYTLDDIASWKKDADNKAEWSKSNTEKAQQIAGVGKFLNKFKEDSDFQEHMKMYFDDEKEFNSFGLSDADVPEVESEQVEVNPLEERLNKLEQTEQNRIIDQRAENLDVELSDLEKHYPEILGNEQQVLEFLDFSERNSARYRDSNGNVSLADMFKEYSFDYLQQELSHYKKLGENKNRNSGKVINRSEVGATETVTPKKYNSWDDVKASDPEINKYFDE
tara:strand:- start:13459 stop:14343 length:885 start_codon:yes stop_codon:yes gene_type:complete